MINPSKSIISFCIPGADFQKNQLDVVYSDIYFYIENVFLIAPWYVRFPVIIIQIAFNVIVFLKYFRCFENLTRVEQQKFIIYWCKLGRPFEGLIRLYRSLVLLKYFELNPIRERR